MARMTRPAGDSPAGRFYVGAETLALARMARYPCGAGPNEPPTERHHMPTTTTTTVDRLRKQAARLSELTGIEFTVGYIGNCDHTHDDRSWYAFAAHPGRVGGYDDRIGGVPTEDLPALSTLLAGAIALARVQSIR